MLLQFIAKTHTHTHVPHAANTSTHIELGTLVLMYTFVDIMWQFKGIVKVTAVNCATQKKICDEYGVKDYPTLKVIPPGGFGTQDYTGERNDKAVYA